MTREDMNLRELEETTEALARDIARRLLQVLDDDDTEEAVRDMLVDHSEEFGARLGDFLERGESKDEQRMLVLEDRYWQRAAVLALVTAAGHILNCTRINEDGEIYGIGSKAGS